MLTPPATMAELFAPANVSRIVHRQAASLFAKLTEGEADPMSVAATHLAIYGKHGAIDFAKKMLRKHIPGIDPVDLARITVAQALEQIENTADVLLTDFMLELIAATSKRQPAE